MAVSAVDDTAQPRRRDTRVCIQRRIVSPHAGLDRFANRCDAPLRPRLVLPRRLHLFQSVGRRRFLEPDPAGNAPGLVSNPLNLAADKGRATYDVTHVRRAECALYITVRPRRTRNPVRPFINPDFKWPVVLGNPGRWFNPAAFIAPPSASGFYGNAGRDTISGPGFAT